MQKNYACIVLLSFAVSMIDIVCGRGCLLGRACVQMGELNVDLTGSGHGVVFTSVIILTMLAAMVLIHDYYGKKRGLS